MIGYVVLGTNDLPRAAAFYDGLFDAMGEGRMIDMPAMIAWGKNWDQPMLAVAAPEDGMPATPGHGSTVALVQTGRSRVDKLHAKALTLGAEDGGAPKLRGEDADQGFYAGYCRDPDGNRLCFFFVGPK